MCNRFPHWVALAQCPFGSAISFPKCLPAVVSPLVLASEGSVWVLACGSKHPSPLWEPMTNGGAEQACGDWARNSPRVPREPPFHCLSGRRCGASVESFMCIGCCWNCFIHHYFYLIQLFLEAIHIQHADYMRTRFSFKNKTHNDSAM